MDNLSSDQNGIVLNDGKTNLIDKNNITLDSLDGILVGSSTNNTVTENMISSVGAGCADASSCNFAGGIHLSDGSDKNTITYNSISNVTVSGKIGAGIVLSDGAAQNLVYQNNASSSDAGIVISDSPANTVSGNNLTSNSTGVYLIGSSNIDLASNTLVGDQQNLYPNFPLVFFTGIRNGTSVNGLVKISWNSTGQAISNQSLSIDGSPQSVSGSSYAWNSTSVPDGIHVITIRITNGAGQNATASLIISTTNHEFLTVEVTGPENAPISNSLITLKNATYSASATTDSSGRALFHGLTSGIYNASTSINGTGIISPVSYTANSTVILFVPTLITTAQALNSSGASVPIEVSGNLTASQLSNVALKNANDGYNLTFDLSGYSRHDSPRNYWHSKIFNLGESRSAVDRK